MEIVQTSGKSRRVTTILTVTRERGGSFAEDIPGEEQECEYEVIGLVTAGGSTRIDSVFDRTNGVWLSTAYLTAKEQEKAHDQLQEAFCE